MRRVFHTDWRIPKEQFRIHLTWIAASLIAPLGLMLSAAELVFDFERTELTEIPNGFRQMLSGKGSPGTWRIISAEVSQQLAPITSKAAPVKRRVLAQLSEDITDERFPLLIYDEQEFGDFEFSTRFKNVSGAFEQMAGIVFRALDERNYYYVRASSIGNTFRFFKVVDGNRSAPIGVDVEIPRGSWHELSVRCRGNQISCFLNGEQLIPTITDNTFSAGRIGFWTKSDAVSYFVDSRINYEPRETMAEVLIQEAVRKYPRILEIRIFASVDGSSANVKSIASTDSRISNSDAGDIERNVLNGGAVYYGKSGARVTVTMPLNDRNGEPIAAVRMVLQSFRGQTEKNAITRAVPIIRMMEERVRSRASLFE